MYYLLFSPRHPSNKPQVSVPQGGGDGAGKGGRATGAVHRSLPSTNAADAPGPVCGQKQKREKMARAASSCIDIVLNQCNWLAGGAGRRIHFPHFFTCLETRVMGVFLGQSNGVIKGG